MRNRDIITEPANDFNDKSNNNPPSVVEFEM